MVHFPKEWVVKHPNPDLIEELAVKLNILKTTSSIMVNRGITSLEEAILFLHPNFLNIENPFLLKDLDAAVARIRRAIDNNQHILIYGDRDADGVTATCIMHATLTSLGASPCWYIPTEQGYGVHKNVIDEYIGKIDLIITVDCGITAYEEVRYAKEKGIDVIITDHHELPSNDADVPAATAVVNPKRKGNLSSFSELAGCAVAFKVAQGLMMSYEKYYNKDMVALDITTTGLHPLFDTLTGITAVRMRNLLPLEHISIDVRTCGIKKALEQMKTFTGDLHCIVHNEEYTLNFLRHACKDHLHKELENPVQDTLALSRELFPFTSFSIEILLKNLGYGSVNGNLRSKGAQTVLKAYSMLEMARSNRMKFFLQDNLDLVTIGTIGDMMPLIGENRTIVKHGLARLKDTRKIGLKLLMDSLNKSDTLTSKDVSYNIVPLINACGRLSRVDLAVKLLLAEDVLTAEDILEKVIHINEERRHLQSTNIDEFNNLINQQCDIEKDKLLFITAEGIEHGVTGIVASKLVRRYNRPAILLIQEGDEAVGAGRSVDGFNIHNAISQCSDLFIKFGGHAKAIGFTLNASDIPELRRRLMDIVNRELTDEMLIHKIDIDSELRLQDLNFALLEELSALEPFGLSNPHPVFMLKALKVDKFSKIGITKEHCKMKIRNPACSNFDVVGWGLADLCDMVLRDSFYVDMVGQIEINHWNNKDILQFSVIDLKTSM